MVDVTATTYWDWFPAIKSAIDSAAFVAIDFEFLGLPSSGGADRVASPSLFDDAQTRYSKIVESVRRFPPCQMGLACFRELGEGTSFEVEVFCVSLFKRIPRKVFSYSLSAVTFLANNRFDFNKFITEGITYANRKEADDIKQEIVEGIFDFDVLHDGLEHRIQMLKINLQIQAVQAERGCGDARLAHRYRNPDMSPPTVLLLSRPLLIELVRSNEYFDTDTVDQSVHPPWDRPLTRIEAAAVVYLLSHEYRNLEFHVNGARTMLYCAEIPLIVRNSTPEDLRIDQLLMSLLREISGVSEIIHMLAERKAPLIGHNSFLDLLYCYESFVDELPDSYETWKCKFRTLFPCVIDTRKLAVFLNTQLSEHGVNEFSLQTLGDFFDSPSCGQILPFSYPVMLDGPFFATARFGDGECYHNAAFDAYVTGKVFIRLLYLYAYTKSAGSGNFARPWTIRKLVFACRNDVAGKIPLPLIDYLHCNLLGPDSEGERPSHLRARKRRVFPILGTVQGEFGDMLTRITDRLFAYAEITDAELAPVCRELKREMSAYKVDMRLSTEERGIALIATNTPTTYARVARYLCSHAWLCPADESAALSFDELLLGAADSKKRRRREKKRRKGDDRVAEVAFWVSTVSAVMFLAGSAMYIRKHFL